MAPCTLKNRGWNENRGTERSRRGSNLNASVYMNTFVLYIHCKSEKKHLLKKVFALVRFCFGIMTDIERKNKINIILQPNFVTLIKVSETL